MRNQGNSGIKNNTKVECSRGRRGYNDINKKMREISGRWRNIQQCSLGGITENIS